MLEKLKIVEGQDIPNLKLWRFVFYLGFIRTGISEWFYFRRNINNDGNHFIKLLGKNFIFGIVYVRTHER